MHGSSCRSEVTVAVTDRHVGEIHGSLGTPEVAAAQCLGPDFGA